MIEINLMPGARRAKATTSRQSIDIKGLVAGLSGKVRDKFLVGAVAAVVIAVAAGAALYLLQSSRATELADHQERALADSTRYAKFLKERTRAEATRDTLLRQVNIIKGLDEDRFVWPHVLDEISRALPQYTWVTNVAITGTPQGQNNVVVIAPKADTSAKHKKARLETEIPKDDIKIQVRGRTVDIQALTRFMTDLENSPFFANVVLDKAETATEQGKEVTEFQFTLGYERPDTLLLHRVPLTLSTLDASSPER